MLRFKLLNHMEKGKEWKDGTHLEDQYGCSFAFIYPVVI